MKLTDSDFYRLVDYMKKNYGINLSKKRVLIEGRLSNMVMEMGFTNFKDYIDFAFSDKTGAETIKLVNKLTTNHTFFLREPAHFDFLKEEIKFKRVEEQLLSQQLQSQIKSFQSKFEQQVCSDIPCKSKVNCL